MSKSGVGEIYRVLVFRHRPGGGNNLVDSADTKKFEEARGLAHDLIAANHANKVDIRKETFPLDNPRKFEAKYLGRWYWDAKKKRVEHNPYGD